MGNSLKILYVAYEIPCFPGGTGGQTRQYNLLKYLSMHHEFHYVGLRIEGDQLDIVKTVFRKIFMPERSPFNRVVTFVAKRIPHGFPRAVQELEGQRTIIKPLILKALRDECYDLIHVEHTNIAHWLHGIEVPLPKIMVAHNVKTIMWQRYAELATGLAKRTLTRDYERFKGYEGRYLKEYDAIVAMSNADKDQIVGLCGAGVETFVVPNGVDPQYFTPANAPTLPGSLVFTGSMAHPPNNEAALYFCREIFPKIRARVPSSKLAIVGSSPSTEVRRLAEDGNVTVTGFVDDTRPYLASAAVVIVPLLSGSGTRLKIMEAMAMGKVIVSTSIGAEGIDYTDGENILIADSPEAFADTVLHLMANPAKCAQIGANARKLVEDRYSWDILAVKVEEVYASVTKHRVRPGDAN
jgi:polysaccharide biosynthesis protein PslH